MLTLISALVSATLVSPNPFVTASQVVQNQAPTPSIVRRKTMYDVKAVALAAKPNSTLFAASLEDGKIRIIDAAGKVAGPTLQGHVQPAYGLAWSPDGKYLLSGDEQARLLYWDSKTGKLVKEFSRLKGHQRGIQSISFAKDGRTFVSVGKDDTLCVWAVNGANPLWKVTGEPANFYGATFTPAGSIATGTQAEGLRLYAPKTFALAAKATLPGGQGASGFALNPAGTLGATCGRDGNVMLFDMKSRNRLGTLKGHTDYVINAAFTPNGRLLASSGSDAQVIFWDVKSMKRIGGLEQMSYVGAPVVFSGDGQFFMTCNANDVVEIYSVTPKQK